ncbi:MAG TPA: (2Fe-2S)-binding protein [Zoogloea sp.]|uniref:(2Fe-2S)-binding protein n=1 Tax=Zoogloea sp. TaxID=49181 RepID=UPI002C45C4F9|nr:(2Fe-2S)-binding protein [Zoogloea sp.]HMV16404.1 (2Fe-2S)-binding protein [Rhodocyclaceae bacterium]HMV61768.1 (2Fe-2S)-binding protein [Rhodocyclaceae bacterium]HMW51140.1 (2Fe-2S)-binding protein [Rhodocyclaceae bacterium]HMY48391.1 (2Fe-2S)-binding protein [Rhodocyclaceae bacterium]HMZ75578.1 (2Fe-2S)-binding protein [Rhodocyclaceae bacterium]
MYVCVCRAITERHITEAVNDGARRLRDLRRDLGVTEECGRCARCAHACLKEAIDQIGPVSILSGCRTESTYSLSQEAA